MDNELHRTSADLLVSLAQILEERKTADPTVSYVARLYAKGLDSILKKIGEEATETIIAAKSDDQQALIHEIADLWFHTLVLLTYRELGPQEVINELTRRFGISGLAEKASRHHHT